MFVRKLPTTEKLRIPLYFCYQSLKIRALEAIIFVTLNTSDHEYGLFNDTKFENSTMWIYEI